MNSPRNLDSAIDMDQEILKALSNLQIKIELDKIPEQSITNVLNHPILLTLLEDAVKNEYSTENLDFLQAVKSQIRHLDSDKIYNEIVETYINEGAKKQINIDSNARNEVSTIRDASQRKNAILNAVKIIVALMNRDTLLRLSKSLSVEAKAKAIIYHLITEMDHFLTELNPLLFSSTLKENSEKLHTLKNELLSLAGSVNIKNLIQLYETRNTLIANCQPTINMLKAMPAEIENLKMERVAQFEKLQSLLTTDLPPKEQEQIRNMLKKLIDKPIKDLPAKKMDDWEKIYKKTQLAHFELTIKSNLLCQKIASSPKPSLERAQSNPSSPYPAVRTISPEPNESKSAPPSPTRKRR